jgi:hypothetical protein
MPAVGIALNTWSWTYTEKIWVKRMLVYRKIQHNICASFKTYYLNNNNYQTRKDKNILTNDKYFSKININKSKEVFL